MRKVDLNWSPAMEGRVLRCEQELRCAAREVLDDAVPT